MYVHSYAYCREYDLVVRRLTRRIDRRQLRRWHSDPQAKGSTEEHSLLLLECQDIYPVMRRWCWRSRYGVSKDERWMVMVVVRWVLEKDNKKTFTNVALIANQNPCGITTTTTTTTTIYVRGCSEGFTFRCWSSGKVTRQSKKLWLVSSLDSLLFTYVSSGAVGDICSLLLLLLGSSLLYELLRLRLRLLPPSESSHAVGASLFEKERPKRPRTASMIPRRENME